MKMNIPVLLNDKYVDELIVIDNCRDSLDREWLDNYINEPCGGSTRKLNIARNNNKVGYGGLYGLVKFNADDIYIKIDDDVLYLNGKCVESVLKCRLADRAAKTVYANIFNNTVCDSLREKGIERLIPEGFEFGPDDMRRRHGRWCSADYAYGLHMKMIDGGFNCPESGVLKIPRRLMNARFNAELARLNLNGRFPINMICFFGRDMLGWIEELVKSGDDEDFFTRRIFEDDPDSYSLISLPAACAHYSFFPQKYSDCQQNDIISGYRKKLMLEYPEIEFNF